MENKLKEGGCSFLSLPTVPFTSKVSSLTYQQDLEEGEVEGAPDESQDAQTAVSLELIREDTEPALRGASASRKQEQIRVSSYYYSCIEKKSYQRCC